MTSARYARPSRRVVYRVGLAAAAIIVLLLGYVVVVGVLRSRPLHLPAPRGPFPVGRAIVTVAAGSALGGGPPCVPANSSRAASDRSTWTARNRIGHRPSRNCCSAPTAAARLSHPAPRTARRGPIPTGWSDGASAHHRHPQPSPAPATTPSATPSTTPSPHLLAPRSPHARGPIQDDRYDHRRAAPPRTNREHRTGHGDLPELVRLPG